MRALAVLLLVVSSSLATAAVLTCTSVGAVPQPIVAAQDVTSITYSRDSTGWHASTVFCPRVNAAVANSDPLPCVTTQAVTVSALTGAFATRLISDAKMTVIAAGYPSGD